jgi:GrpB-like predicted nucleotidyltransferase (UPF0157 family)
MPTREQIVRFSDGEPPPGADPWVSKPLNAPVEVVEYDPRWPTQAREIIHRLYDILGVRALRIDHVGSTAVEGLPAKPVIDLDVTVADPANEVVWLPQLEAAGFVLTVREPWWYEHRMLRGGRRADDRVIPSDGGPATNVHVFGPDSPELIRHLVFRNWLRVNESDRALYAAAKREASSCSATGLHVMEYNARKQTVVREIFGRAFEATGFLDQSCIR